MLKIVYCADGEPMSDFKVHRYVDFVLDHYNNHTKGKFDRTIYTASELCLSVFGLRAMEGKILFKDIEFYFEDIKLELDPYQGFKYPAGVKFGFHVDVARKILEVGMQRALKEKGYSHHDARY